MSRSKILTLILSISLVATGNINCFAKDIDYSSKIIDLITLTPLMNYDNAKKSQSYNSLGEFNLAMQRFMQANTTVAYREFGKVVHTCDEGDDFLFFNLAYEFSQVGLFSLAQNSIVQINDRQIWLKQIEGLKAVYFPSVTLSIDDEIKFGEMYANIVHNNMAQEVIKELNKEKNLLKKYDYANYLLSLAHYKERNFSKALNAINKAISFDASNLNYLKFKAQILSDDKKYKESNSIIEEIDKNNIILTNFNQEINLLKVYNNGRSSNNFNGKFQLAKYYFDNHEEQRAIKELNNILAKKKKFYQAYTLLGDISFKGKSIDRAKEYYEKSYKINKKYPKTLIGLGNIHYTINDYTKAIYFYKEALRYDQENYDANLGLSLVALAKGDTKLAEEYIHTASLIDSKNYMTDYVFSKIDKNNSEQYLKRSLALNPLFMDAWMDLTQIALDENNYSKAQKCIMPLKLLAPKNDRYLELTLKLNSYYEL